MEGKRRSAGMLRTVVVLLALLFGAGILNAATALGAPLYTEDPVGSWSPLWLWSVDCVDVIYPSPDPGQSDYPYYPSLALDRAGGPHVAYASGGRLWYASLTTSGWEYQIVNFNGQVVVDEQISLRIDSTDRPHIAFYDSVHGYLRYARRYGTVWENLIVDPSSDVGRHVSLALDGSDTPHLAYHDATYRRLKYARWNGTGWDIETIDDRVNVGPKIALAVDAAGNAQAVYPYIDSLLYAQRVGSRWQADKLNQDGRSAFGATLAVDRSGHAHTAYFEDDLQGGWFLTYASRSGESWVSQHVIHEPGTGYLLDLALNTADNPGILYEVGNHGVNLFIAQQIGTTWDVYGTWDITGRPNSVIGGALAYDDSGYPHAVFHAPVSYVVPPPPWAPHLDSSCLDYMVLRPVVATIYLPRMQILQ